MFIHTNTWIARTDLYLDAHAQKLFKDLKLKNLGHYHDFYIQRDTLLLQVVFENFRNKCIKIYKLDPAHFLSEPGLAWNIDMLLMVEKGIRGRICHPIHIYPEANNKCLNNYNKNIESSYLMYLDANNLYE